MLDLHCCTQAFFNCCRWGLFSSSSPRASHHCGFSRGTRVLGLSGPSTWAQYWSSWVLECRLGSWNAWAWLSHGMMGLLDQGSNPCLRLGRRILYHWTTGEIAGRFYDAFDMKLLCINHHSCFWEMLLFCHPVVSDSLRPHGLKPFRSLCPSPSPQICPSSCPQCRGLEECCRSERFEFHLCSVHFWLWGRREISY